MKTKKYKKIIISVLIFTMIVLYGYIPSSQNAMAVDSIVDASDTISDSVPNRTAIHTFTFTTGTTTPAGGWWSIVFPSGGTGFTGVGSGVETCAYGDANFTASSSGQIVDCVVTGDEAATTSQVVVTEVTNPNSELTKYIEIYLYNASGFLLERVTVAVAIIEDVLVTARVDSSLTFTVDGLDGIINTVNGITCTATTTATSTPFGTLVVNATSTVCQRLNVTTNADDGYVVTVWQDQELTSDSGSNINSFSNSPNLTGSTTPQIWQVPLNTRDQYNTYGHMGLTSNDDDAADDGLMANDYYQGGLAYYVGLSSSSPMEIMAHVGPSDGSTQNIGQADIAYSAQVASLQEAGDYESTLTYICTATF